MKCTNCGYDNVPEAGFCADCGTRLVTEVEPPSPEAEPAPPKLPGKGLLVGVIIAALAITGISVGLALLSDGTTTTPPTTQADSETGIPGTRADLELQNDVLAMIRMLEFSCTNPEVVNIEVTENVTVDGIWEERWTLDSCGVTVAYDLRFAPDGIGGTFFSVIKAPSTTTTPTTTTPTTTTPPTTPVTFPDTNLEAAIREAISKPEGPIYQSDLEALTMLVAEERNISNLTGLEYCVNLRLLDLEANNISNISALAKLTNLEWLSLSANDIDDISALANLTNLERLYLSSSDISDISPLADLANLEWLWIYGNSISDISPLASLTNLERLYLQINNISDISALAGLTNLQVLRLSLNNISDISALAGLIDLQELHLQDNNISDISPLLANSGLATGDRVTLRGNPLSTTSVDVYILQLEARGVTVGWRVPPPPTTTTQVTDLVGDKDGFGLGLTEGDERGVGLGFFDNREQDDPFFTDVIPTSSDFSYDHTFNLDGQTISFAQLNLFTFGVQDGDTQVAGMDTDIRLFLDGMEIIGAFDDLDQFRRDGSQWVEIAGSYSINIPASLLSLLSDGSVEVRIQILNLGTASSTDAIAIDYSELIIGTRPA